MASIPTGNVENGEKLFKGRCAQCHTVNSGGAFFDCDCLRRLSSVLA
jgi:mono/diheme cytochrome c family protein